MVATMDTSDFLETVAKTYETIPHFEGMIKQPESGEGTIAVVPELYSTISEWHSNKYGVTREQYAMCA
jgi:hypothetical protein